MEWNAVIFGPTDTPFEDGTFKLTIKFSGQHFIIFIGEHGNAIFIKPHGQSGTTVIQDVDWLKMNR